MNKRNDKTLFVYSRRNFIPIFIGILLITVYMIIFKMLHFKNISFNYELLFMKLNINNIPIVVFGIFHTAILALGILIVFFSFIKMSTKVICKNNRFIIVHFLQPDKVIPYDKVNVHPGKVYISKTDSLFLSKKIKEFRILFENPIYSFYLFYEVKGFQDEVDEIKESEVDFNQRRIYASRSGIEKLLNFLNRTHFVKTSYLPPEES